MKKGYIYELYLPDIEIDMVVIQISDTHSMLIKNTYNTNEYKIGKIAQWEGPDWKEKGTAFNYYLKLL